MMKNGKTKAGTQRWRCGRCGASSVRKIDSAAKALAMFVRWLLGKLAQCELGIPARTFRDKTARFWSLWPILPACDEAHHFACMDGIWLVCNKAVVLIACTDAHVIGRHLAKSENAKDWARLMQRIAAPDVLVCDGAGGIGKAMRAVWPETRMQRRAFHVFRQVKRCTTTRPKTQAGVDLYAIAKDLMRVEDDTEAAVWMARFQGWCAEYEGLLRERSETDRRKYRHERLRKARRAGGAVQRRDAVHLPRRGRRRRRRRALDVEQDREPERSDKEDALPSSRHERRPQGEGGLLVLLHGVGGPRLCSTDAEGVPDRRGRQTVAYSGRKAAGRRHRGACSLGRRASVV